MLVTGHTGFKGAWLCLLLEHLGVRTSGLALPAAPGGAFDMMRPAVESSIVDIRDVTAVALAVRRVRPEIVVHLAAQALVGKGYAQPLATFATNVMGTAHLLEAAYAVTPTVVLAATTDKVYRDDERGDPYDEDSPLGGADPYSASKVATEQVVAAWRSRLREVGCRAATARAGNVIGGGDVGAGRLVPDVVQAHRAGQPVMLRRPGAVRPWQAVLDVLAGYLIYIQALSHGDAPPALNFGPDPNSAITAADLTTRLQQAFGGSHGWRQGDPVFGETNALRLDSRRAMQTLGWQTSTTLQEIVASTAAWHQAAWRADDMRNLGRAQVAAWMGS